MSRRNLQREGVADGNIYVVGNTVIDALHLVLEQIGVRKDIEKNIQFVLERVGIPLSVEEWRAENGFNYRTSERKFR